MKRSPESHNPQEPPKTSRREFLKSAAIIGAAAALTSCGADLSNKPISSAEKQRFTETIDKIIIDGSPEFIEKTKNALKLLSDTSFPSIKYYLGRITQAEYSGMRAWEKIPTFQVGETTWKSPTEWYASTIAHDAYHSFLYHDYDERYEKISVTPQAWKGAKMEKKCLEFQHKILKELNANEEDIRYVEELIKNPTYQDIPNRDW